MIKAVFLASLLFLVSGCSIVDFSSSDKTVESVKPSFVTQNIIQMDKRYTTTSDIQNDDVKKVIDTGIMLKLQIFPYITEDKILISEHSIFFWVREPGFVVGEDVPRKNQQASVFGMPFKNTDINQSDSVNQAVSKLETSETTKSENSSKSQLSEQDKQFLQNIIDYNNERKDKK